MKILDAIRFVRGAVPTRDHYPQLKHVLIKDKTIRAFNGTIAIQAPINTKLTAAPQADAFAKAVAAADDKTRLQISKIKGNIVLKMAGRKITVPCIDTDEYPDIPMDGERFTFDGELLPALRDVAPFIAKPPCKPYAQGVMLVKSWAVAGHMTTVIARKMTAQFPTFLNLPDTMVKELLRIGEEPQDYLISPHCIVACYENGGFVYSKTIDMGWPNVFNIIDVNNSIKPDVDPSLLLSQLKQLKPFSENNMVQIHKGKITTTSANKVQAEFECKGLVGAGFFNIDDLMRVAAVSDGFTLAAYPERCAFSRGDDVRGVLLGYKA